LGFTRHINTIQVRAAAATGSYQQADQLPISQPLPEGFELRLAAAGRAYAFSVQDTTDPCRFAYFSDQMGLIFRGEVIR
jgi:hypothetical protein